MFYIWGTVCFFAMVFVFLMVPETKGLSLEQIDRMFEESVPRNSAKWVPHSTFAADMGLTEKDTVVEEVENVVGKSAEGAALAVSASRPNMPV